VGFLMHVSGTITGLDLAITGLEDDSLAIRQAAFRGVLLALNKLYQACEQMLSPNDHTLIELALMGHPYSAAHGQAIHVPDELVHLQSGQYRAALKRESPSGAGGAIIGGSIYIGDEQADIDRWIQEGTTLMRARPWMQWVVDRFGQDAADLIVAMVDQAIRDNPQGPNTITPAA
jgi:hypothetical protein